MDVRQKSVGSGGKDRTTFDDFPFEEPIEEISYLGSDLLPAVVRMLLTTGFTLATMFVLSPMLTLAVVPLIPVFLIARQYYRKKLAADADAMQCDRLVWNNFLQEHLSAAIPIQLLGREKRQEREAFRVLARGARSQQRLCRTEIWFTICSSVAVTSAMCAVIGYGGARVLGGRLTVGSLVAFYGFVAQLFDPLSGAAEILPEPRRSLPVFARCNLCFCRIPAWQMRLPRYAFRKNIHLESILTRSSLDMRRTAICFTSLRSESWRVNTWPSRE